MSIGRIYLTRYDNTPLNIARQSISHVHSMAGENGTVIFSISWRRPTFFNVLDKGRRHVTTNRNSSPRGNQVNVYSFDLPLRDDYVNEGNECEENFDRRSNLVQLDEKKKKKEKKKKCCIVSQFTEGGCTARQICCSFVSFFFFFFFFFVVMQRNGMTYFSIVIKKYKSMQCREAISVQGEL